MKIAILGGSFNPVHIGHLILADCVCAQLSYDKIIFVPVSIPPHKKMSEETSAFDRLKMLNLSTKNDKRFIVDDCELRRGGISYTWDTICFLEKKYEKKLSEKIGVILGEDVASDFEKWKFADKIAEKCELIVALRCEKNTVSRDFENIPLGKYAEHKSFSPQNFNYPCVFVQNPNIEISSSFIRQCVSKESAWRYLVSRDVFKYIKKRKLYGFLNSRD